MTIRLDPSVLLDTVIELRATADRLDRQQQAACQRVETLLDGGWSGGAARCYREAWEQWVAGSREVGTALTTLADLVASARSDLLTGDEGVALDLDRLAPRDTDGGTW